MASLPLLSSSFSCSSFLNLDRLTHQAAAEKKLKANTTATTQPLEDPLLLQFSKAAFWMELEEEGVG